MKKGSSLFLNTASGANLGFVWRGGFKLRRFNGCFWFKTSDTSSVTCLCPNLISFKTTDVALFHCMQVIAAMTVLGGVSLSDTSCLRVRRILPFFEGLRWSLHQPWKSLNGDILWSLFVTGRFALNFRQVSCGCHPLFYQTQCHGKGLSSVLDNKLGKIQYQDFWFTLKHWWVFFSLGRQTYRWINYRSICSYTQVVEHIVLIKTHLFWKRHCSYAVMHMWWSQKHSEIPAPKVRLIYNLNWRRLSFRQHRLCDTWMNTSGCVQ